MGRTQGIRMRMTKTLIRFKSAVHDRGQTRTGIPVEVEVERDPERRVQVVQEAQMTVVMTMVIGQTITGRKRRRRTS